MEHSKVSILMDATELEHYLGITKNSAYALLHSEEFPTVRVGGRFYAIRAEVDAWIVRQARKGGYTYGNEEKKRSR